MFGWLPHIRLALSNLPVLQPVGLLSAIWLALNKALYKLGLKLTQWPAYRQLDVTKKCFYVLNWVALPAAQPSQLISRAKCGCLISNVAGHKCPACQGFSNPDQG